MPDDPKFGRFVITQELLCQSLHLPEGVRIASVRESQRPGDFEILVEGDGLPAVPEGGAVPWVSPMWRDKSAVIETEFVGW